MVVMMIVIVIQRVEYRKKERLRSIPWLRRRSACCRFCALVRYTIVSSVSFCALLALTRAYDIFYSLAMIQKVQSCLIIFGRG